jgi:hypothetical protein
MAFVWVMHFKLIFVYAKLNFTNLLWMRDHHHPSSCVYYKKYFFEVVLIHYSSRMIFYNLVVWGGSIFQCVISSFYCIMLYRICDW